MINHLTGGDKIHIFQPSYGLLPLYDRVAQPVEHSTFNRVVVGSNPTAVTILYAFARNPGLFLPQSAKTYYFTKFATI